MSFSSVPCSTETFVFVGLPEADWSGRDRPKNNERAHWCGSLNVFPLVKHLDAQGRSTSRAKRPKFCEGKPASVIAHR